MIAKRIHVARVNTTNLTSSSSIEKQDCLSPFGIYCLFIMTTRPTHVSSCAKRKSVLCVWDHGTLLATRFFRLNLLHHRALPAITSIYNTGTGAWNWRIATGVLLLYREYHESFTTSYKKKTGRIRRGYGGSCTSQLHTTIHELYSRSLLLLAGDFTSTTLYLEIHHSTAAEERQYVRNM